MSDSSLHSVSPLAHHIKHYCFVSLTVENSSKKCIFKEVDFLMKEEHLVKVLFYLFYLLNKRHLQVWTCLKKGPCGPYLIWHFTHKYKEIHITTLVQCSINLK